MGFSAALLAACAFTSFPTYDVLSVGVTSPHSSLQRVEYRVEVEGQSLNRFSITHVSKKHGRSKGDVLLLSPFSLPGAFYEISETGDYRASAAGELAKSGYDVWLVDQRRTGLPPGACESGTDCSAMAGWNFDAYSKDALFALELIKTEHPRSKPVVGGFSAGSNAALATLNRAPHAFAGVFLYEGTFYNEDPAIRAHNLPICNELNQQIAGGATFSPGPGFLGASLQLAQAAPSDPSPFIPELTNRGVMLTVFGKEPPPFPLAIAPTAGFIRNKLDSTGQAFAYTNEARLQLVGPLFDSYGSLPALRDLACGLAGSDDSFYDRVDEFDGDVLIFVEGTGFGPAMFDTAALFEHADDVTIDSNPELGEADPYFGFAWKQKFLKPLEKWLKKAL